ncbi:DUF1043 family protein [Methylonatrum kenyense]|uniref:YhcB family protein n=1 Tax=Methylonatrum kenyense TaxID=455253 RepID=UPI0020C07C55|nr:DUF1043 family protein [Methylonatrum kenyense]MCK8515688.1 DUF1043 family protein [Methylonatrum kenyense]
MSMTVVWFLIVIAAAIAAFVIGRYTAPGSARVRELEEQRDESSRELRFYREQVNSHFQTTAQLFNDVTASYRSLYEHLADGSEKLGQGPDSPLLATPPEQRQLDEQLSSSESAPESGKDTSAGEEAKAGKSDPTDPAGGGDEAPDDKPEAEEGGEERQKAEAERWSLDDMKPRAEAETEPASEQSSDEEPRKTP